MMVLFIEENSKKGQSPVKVRKQNGTRRQGYESSRFSGEYGKN